MVTLVQVRNSTTSPDETASLVADYMAFERRRASRRQYQKAFGGIAVIVLLGGLMGCVPSGEAEIAGALLMAPTLVLSIIELFHWRGLVHRLSHVRAELRYVRKL
jgi:hypothetical protein